MQCGIQGADPADEIESDRKSPLATGVIIDRIRRHPPSRLPEATDGSGHVERRKESSAILIHFLKREERLNVQSEYGVKSKL